MSPTPDRCMCGDSECSSCGEAQGTRRIVAVDDPIYVAICKLTPKQRDVLGHIAISEDGGHHPRTLVALESKGLIASYEQAFPGWPPMIVKRWLTPTPVHMAWCQWCSDHYSEEDERD